MDDFPCLIGRVALSSDKSWSMHLPIVLQMRVEDGQMVFWQPGFTLFLSVWNNDRGESAASRLAYFKDKAAPGAFDLREGERDSFLCYSYRLKEAADDDRVPGLYGFVFGEKGHVQGSMYFDEEETLDLAEFLLAGLSHAPPDLDEPNVLSDLCFVTQALEEDGAELGVMYRDEADSPDVSGWEFFTGRESADYLNDADNVSMCPVAFVAERFPDIIPYLNAEVGSEFKRREGGLARSE